MAIVLPAFPANPAHRYTITLGEARFVVRLTWRDRTASWYMDLLRADETPLALGRRVSPGSGPLVGLRARIPEIGGTLIVVGPDPHQQADLGPRRDVQILYFTDAEVAALEPETDPNSAVKIVLS